MFPLVDIHCHLLAGLDDGPRDQQEALDLCRMVYAEGVRTCLALAHQNARYPSVTPDRIRQSTQQLASLLRKEDLGLTVLPGAEVMVHPDLEDWWEQKQLLSVADRGEYVLLEMPHGLFVDLSDMVHNLRRLNVRPILAHPEREPILLHEPGRIERLIEAGCLVQVSSSSVTDPRDRRDERALKSWFRRGVAHLLGSDGHSPTRRPVRMQAAYQRICRWAGNRTADRVCATNGLAVLHGLPLKVTPPEPLRFRWLSALRR